MVDYEISLNNLADILTVSRATVESWTQNGKYPFHLNQNGTKMVFVKDLMDIDIVSKMAHSNWTEELTTKPSRGYTSVELFAGAGGLALGLEQAGFSHVLLNEMDKFACQTLRKNRPNWNVVEGDIHEIDFSSYKNKVDMLSGGFPCQAFSYAGKRLGFEETRGTLFFELARAVNEIRPKVFLCENVKGLVEHEHGRTLQTIKNVISELGYTLVPPKVLKAVLYNVPQKRERLILVAIRNDIAPFVSFKWPDPFYKVRTLRDAFCKGDMYDCDVPTSIGAQYPLSKKEVLALVPQGGDWRNLPPEIAKDYMKGSYNLGGGKTGMARRLSMDEPSLTLTCSPAQKQTERCHPLETRPLTVREYARLQTFPDDWSFCGSIGAQYKQIGNAVPVNLSWAVGRALIRLFNQIEELHICTTEAIHCNQPVMKMHGMFEGMVCDDNSPYGA